MLTKKTLINYLFTACLLTYPMIIHGQILPPCTATGNCGICDFLQTFVNIIRWVLGVLGGTALLLMIWHGFQWLTAAGNKEKIESGRKGLMHTVLGVLIILGSWFIINTVMIVILTEPGTSPLSPKQSLFFQTISNSGKLWYIYCGGNISGEKFCQQGYSEGTPCGDGKFCLLRCRSWNATNSMCPQGNEQITCDIKNYYGNIYYLNACQYWSCHPSRTEFRNYGCVASVNSCVPGKILGPDYCANSTICCEAITPSEPSCPE
jgi:hypothetical protein